MPRRDDLRKILIIGSGPIVIGQACEFDYSGTQACKALREDGYKVVLVNSNPATIMTDPQMSDRTYVEPITAECVAKIIARERPDAVLPTLGGQTGLNTAVELAEKGVLAKYGVEMIGATCQVIRKAEDRELFKEAVGNVGLASARSGRAYTMEQARAIRDRVGLPCVIRPAFTLGGTGGGIAYNVEEFEQIASRGLAASLIREILIEESLAGWKEFELEVMRDRKDNAVIVCSIENFDPMGVHTGDSITVAPAQTLSDKEYQLMRDAALAVIREIGVQTGGANIQFAVNPDTGEMVVIEMNPRVSRSSALASKATGFPIARIAAKLAVGYTLDEIPNDITRETPACFEPTIDYCVVKIPRWPFEKFPDAESTLGTQMKSVGEAMAIGRTFKEALQKAIRSLEIGRFGLGLDPRDPFLAEGLPRAEEINKHLEVPNAERIFYLRFAMKSGMSLEDIHAATRIDPWFLDNVKELVEFEDVLLSYDSHTDVPAEIVRRAKRLGYSDVQLATVWRADEPDIREWRKSLGIEPVYKLVDTCAAEFEAYTPYYYSTYEDEDESRPTDERTVIILGSGPNRIGQGIEFDYCCVHAAFALAEENFETVMVNSNPETVSTDYDTSDRLYFEPLTLEDVLNVCDKLDPWGVIVQLGGQTPLNLAEGLRQAGVPIIGTSVESIDLAEDRKCFQELLGSLGLVQPPNDTATNARQARTIAGRIGYPVVVRPSYVLGGRAMEIVYDDEELDEYMSHAVDASPERPVLVDKFLEDAIEVDVDAVADGTEVVVAAVMEHIEQAGVHSGDSVSTIPPFSLSDTMTRRIKEHTYALARRIGVKGLMNVQYAVKGEIIYVLEVNPRASRTVPFCSKATGVSWAKIAAKVMTGMTLAELGITADIEPEYFSVKEPVFPFNKFAGIDIILGPEMRSTGEVMGIDRQLGFAFAKGRMASANRLPAGGKIFISVNDADKRGIILVARRLADLGFEIVSTTGTHKVLERNGVPATHLRKIAEGVRPNVVDLIKNGEIALVINTPSGRRFRRDEIAIRQLTVLHNIPCITTLSGALATVNGIESMMTGDYEVKALQDYHDETAR